MLQLTFAGIFLLVFVIFWGSAFRTSRGLILKRTSSALASSTEPESSKEEQLTKVGSKEYYEGFLGSSIEDGVDRGDGLKQAFALAGYSAVFLSILTLLFLKSNGIF